MIRRILSRSISSAAEFTFQTTPNVVCSPGASSGVGDIMAQLGCRNVRLVTDDGVASAGLLDATLSSCQDAGVSLSLDLSVVADPPESLILASVESALTDGVDGIIGLGGGSPMDTAKLIAYLVENAKNGEDPLNLLESIYGVGMASGSRLPLVVLPTTAGTGSEVTPISIVTVGEGIKKGVVDPVLYPDWAVLDADLTLGLPLHVTAATGIDAMVHAIEAFTSKNRKNVMSDALAIQAMRLLWGNLDRVCGSEEGARDRDARSNMLLGSMLAGMSFANSPVAAVHALAYPVGGIFHVPHGLSNSLVLPHVLRFNIPEAGNHYAELARVVFGEEENVDTPEVELTERFIEELVRFAQDYGLETTLREVGIVEDDLEMLATESMLRERLLVNNPREVTFEDALAIYTAAF